jgi:transcriptional regulator with PAS, ATPase and Fis domain
VAINCAAFSREILESELFGHKAGAFTGALKDKKGLFEVAHKGTIFLDEIGEMSLDLQAKLLRVLESGTFLRVGDTKEVKVDVRVISATNRDLEKESQTGHFRLDLYYRLSVFQISLPALRERKTDIALLSKHFIKDLSKKYGFQQVTMSSEFQQILENYTWPGNIRELKNIIERALILQNDGVLQKDCLPPNLIHHAQADAPSGLDLQSVEKFHIEKVLQHTKGNKTETARLLNIGLTTLYRKMEEYGISLKL